MRNKVSWSVFLLVTFLTLLLFLISCIFRTEQSSDSTEQSSDRDELTLNRNEENMSREEIIELFYNNFDTFDKVREYIMNTTGGFYCDNNTGLLLIK